MMLGLFWKFLPSVITTKAPLSICVQFFSVWDIIYEQGSMTAGSLWQSSVPAFLDGMSIVRNRNLYSY